MNDGQNHHTPKNPLAPQRSATPQVVELSAQTSVWICSHTGHEVGDIAVQVKKLGLQRVEVLRHLDDLIEKLKTLHPDLVILDIHRDAASGIELIKDLKTSPDYANFSLLPLVSPTHWTPHESLLGQYGVHAYCPHPLSPKELLSAAVKALAAFKTSPFEQLIQQAKQAYRNKDYTTSENLFLSIRKARTSIRTEIGLAHVSLAKGDQEAAESYTQSAAQYDPKSFQVMLLKLADLLKGNEEELFLGMVRSLLPSCIPPERLVQLAKIFHHNPVLGAQAYIAHKKSFVESPRAQLEGAKLYYSADLFPESLALAKTLYAAAFSSAELLNLLGILVRRKGEFELAIQYYKEALRLGKPDYRVLFNLGLCLEEAKKPTEAQEAYEQCLKLAPQFDKAWERLGGLKRHG